MILSVVATESIVSCMGLILLGKVTIDYLITGFIASLFVASLISTLLMYFFRLQKELEVSPIVSEATPDTSAAKLKLKPSAKIVVGYVSLVVLLVLAGGAGVKATKVVAFNFDKAINQTLPVVNSLNALRNDVLQELARAEIQQHSLTAESLEQEQTIDRGVNLRVEADLSEAYINYRHLIELYFPNEGRTLRKITEKLEKFQSSLSKVKFGTSRKEYLAAAVAANELIDEIDLAIEREHAEFDEQNNETVISIKSQEAFLLILGALALALALWGSRMLIRQHRDLESQVAMRTQELSESLRLTESAANDVAKTLAMMKATLEATDNGILVIDREGNVISANKRFAELWRIPSELLESGDDRRLLDHVLEQLDDPQAFISKVMMLYEKPEESSQDTLKFKDGRVFSRTSHPEFLDDLVVGRVWSFLDITDQYQSHFRIMSLSSQLKEELQVSERQKGLLESLLDAIPDLVWVKNPDGVFLVCNPSFEKLYGHPADEIVGKTDYDFVDHEIADFFRENDIKAATARRLTENDEWLTFASDGYKGLFEVKKTPVFDKENNLVGVLGIARDVTQMRGLLEEVEKARNEAVNSNEAKSSFLANMSHEIRTPMNAIIGMAELCLKTPLNDVQHNYVTKIQSASDSLLHIIDDVLDFSKIEAGKLQMESVPFVLESVFDQLTSVLALRAETKGIELLYDIADDSKLLLGDPMRLGQVLINLVGNALKFSVGGNVVVTVKPEFKENSVVELLFSVKDEGIGISPDQVAKLFNPFVQADASTTRRFGGTGLGLTISQRIVEMMGGRIWVESRLGEGSTFYFTVTLSSAGTDRRYGLLSLAEKLAEHAHRPVLVVDDCLITLRIMKKLIGELGLRVDCAESATQALELLAAPEVPDYLACFVDWRMPVVDGIETMRRLREAFADRNVAPIPPMILTTVYSHHDDLEKISHLIDGLLAKPISSRHVYHELAQCLGVFSGQQPTHDRRKHSDHEWSRFRNLDILLVEDIEVNQEVIMELLRSVGMQVRLARNGLEALEEIAKAPPGLILMDCQMPGMDGYEATSKIRETYSAEMIPIIALTANAFGSDVSKCFEVGMNAHITKPVRMGTLYQKMLYCLPDSVPDMAAPRETVEVEDIVFPPFQGIDTAVGLVNFDDRKSLFLRVLKQFRDNQGQNFERQFNEAFDLSDWKTLKRLAHSLKGVAQTIGAKDLGDSSVSLLAATEAQDKKNCRELFEVVAGHLRFVVDGLIDIDRIADNGFK